MRFGNIPARMTLTPGQCWRTSGIHCAMCEFMIQPPLSTAVQLARWEAGRRDVPWSARSRGTPVGQPSGVCVSKTNSSKVFLDFSVFLKNTTPLVNSFTHLKAHKHHMRVCIRKGPQHIEVLLSCLCEFAVSKGAKRAQIARTLVRFRSILVDYRPYWSSPAVSHKLSSISCPSTSRLTLWFSKTAHQEVDSRRGSGRGVLLTCRFTGGC